MTLHRGFIVKTFQANGRWRGFFRTWHSVQFLSGKLEVDMETVEG
jgi:hypothetical protein